MKQLFLILIITFIVLLGCNNENTQSIEIKAQITETIDSLEVVKTYPDSSEFYINNDYVKCIESGTAVCECLSKNQFVMLCLDMKNSKILIQSSVYFFGLETSVKLDMKRSNNDSLKYIVDEIWPLGDSLVVDFSNDRLKLIYSGFEYRFTKKWLGTLDIPNNPKGLFTYNSEIWVQRNTLNSKSLLAYRYTDQENQLIDIKELRSLIKSNKVTISCSDDFHYNSMWIKKGDSSRSFHLEYDNEKVTIYEESPNGRNRFEEIELDKLEKQEFYKEQQ